MATIIKHNIPNIIAILFGILVIMLIPSQVNESLLSKIGSRFFPYMLSYGIIIFSLGSIIASLLKREEVKEKNSETATGETIKEKSYFLRALLVFILFIGWIVATPILGFVITTVILLVATTWIMGNRNKYLLILVPILTTCFIYFLFKVFLRISLPTGFFI